MSRIWGLMDVGRRSMMNSQTALQTVSHNIANKSTPGYSRQRVEVQANEPVSYGRLQIGTGSKASAVTRTNNSYLERQIEKEGNLLGFFESRSQAMHRVEEVYNEQINKGLNKYLTDFFNAFRELANTPESLASRTQVKEAANFLTRDFGRAHRQLTDIQRDLDFQIRTEVEGINSITSEVAKLNERIQHIELNGVVANDERDRRDQLIKELSGKINIRYAEGKDGMVTVTAGTSAVLVSGHSQRELQVAETPPRPGKREGNVDVMYFPTDKNSAVRITDQLNGGTVGGAIEVRDKVINGFLGDLDEMAYSLANEVNQIHTSGYNRYNQNNGLFFEEPVSVEGAAANLSVYKPILTDVGLIATAAVPGAPGDNRIANVIHQLQFEKFMQDQTSTLDDFYSAMVSRAGIEAQRASAAFESQRDGVAQLKNIRESISGVSLDEEATRMIEFQKTFDASARVIRAADEMMDTVLNLKRV